MIVRIIGRFICACVIASAFQSQAQAQALTQAQTPTTLRVITFDGGWNLPLWAAQRQGFFEAQGLAVQLSYTPTSVFLVTAVLEGRADIAFAGFDNVVAYQEGQGEAKIPDNPDLFAFIGGDGGFLAIVAAPAVKRFEDLKGKTLSVDAMTTGFAFVARELVASNALAETDVNFVRAGGTANRYRELIAGKHDATLLRTPFELLAQNRGTHWLYDRANREIVEAILIANVRDMTPVLAKQSYDLLLGDKGGLSRDLAPDLAGMRTVLRLRGKFGSPPKTLTDPMKYVDLSYREKALGKP